MNLRCCISEEMKSSLDREALLRYLLVSLASIRFTLPVLSFLPLWMLLPYLCPMSSILFFSSSFSFRALSHSFWNCLDTLKLVRNWRRKTPATTSSSRSVHATTTTTVAETYAYPHDHNSSSCVGQVNSCARTDVRCVPISGGSSFHATSIPSSTSSSKQNSSTTTTTQPQHIKREKVTLRSFIGYLGLNSAAQFSFLEAFRFLVYWYSFYQ